MVTTDEHAAASRIADVDVDDARGAGRRRSARRRTTPTSRSCSSRRARPGAPKPVLLTTPACSRCMDGVLRTVRGGAPSDGSGRRRRTSSRCRSRLWAGIYNVCFAFRVGAPVVLMERFEPHEFAELVTRHGIRSVVLPPAAMAMLSDDDDVTSLEPLGGSAASARRCRRSRRAGSTTVRRRRSSTRTARPSSAARSSAGARRTGASAATTKLGCGRPAARGRRGARRSTASSRCATPPGRRVRRRDRDRRPGHRRRLVPHRRHRPHRRRRLRVGRGPRVRPDQPRRHEGRPRRGRGGAARGARRSARPRSSACPTTVSARCRWRSSSPSAGRARPVDVSRRTAASTSAPWKMPVRFETVDYAPPQRGRQGPDARAVEWRSGTRNERRRGSRSTPSGCSPRRSTTASRSRIAR